MCARSGPQGADVTAVCVRFSDHELQLHDRYIRREMRLGGTGLNPTNSVLWSKVIAAARMPQVLGSIHLEVWALTQAFNSLFRGSFPNGFYSTW